MANQFSKGHTFVPGEVVDPDDLNNLVDQAIAQITGGLISEQPTVTANTADYVLIGDTSDSGKLKKSLISALPTGVTGVNWSATPPAVFGTTNPSPGGPTVTLGLNLNNQAPNKVLAGPASGTTGGSPGFRALAPADMATGSQNIAASLVDLTLGNVFFKTLTATPTTIHLKNGIAGQVIKVWIQQKSGGGALLHWITDDTGGVILWPGGNEPVLTAGSLHIDIFEFLCTGSGNYYGICWGKDMLA